MITLFMYTFLTGCSQHIIFAKSLESFQSESEVKIEKFASINDCFEREIKTFKNLCMEKEGRLYMYSKTAYGDKNIICAHDKNNHNGVITDWKPSDPNTVKFLKIEELCHDDVTGESLYYRPIENQL